MQPSKKRTEIENEIYASELTEEDLSRRYVASHKNSDKRKYESNLKHATKVMLSSNYATVDGSVMSVADKIALNVVKGVLDKGTEATTDDLINLQKATGEYQEKQEVQVSGLSEMLREMQGDKF